MYNMINRALHEHPIADVTPEGVPFLAIPPSAATADPPVIVAWHLLDPPRTEQAFAAALPLTAVDAWKFYLGLPMSGSRFPAGGPDEFFGLLARDAPSLVHGPLHAQAVDEFPAAFAYLCETFGVAPSAPVGLLGGSMGSAVAAGVLASGSVTARATVLVSPMLQLREMIDAVAPQFGGYTWTAESNAHAERMDFVARASEVAARAGAIRLIAGADDAPAFTDPARRFAERVGADLVVVDGVGHALAEEPGIERAPQNDAARRYDSLAGAWFATHLAG